MKTKSTLLSAAVVFLLLTLPPVLWNCTDHEVPAGSQFELDATSVAEWKGYLRTGYFNEGSIAVGSDDFIIEEGVVKSGSFTIPVSSIINFNLPTPEVKQQLVHHLQSPDFFNMALHPNVQFHITSVTPFSGSGDGVIAGANYQVAGNLTLLGKSLPLAFPARIDVAGELFKLEAFAPFDRTLWGMSYAADPSLPDEAYIKPVIDVHLKLSGHKVK